MVFELELQELCCGRSKVSLGRGCLKVAGGRLADSKNVARRNMLLASCSQNQWRLEKVNFISIGKKESRVK